MEARSGAAVVDGARDDLERVCDGTIGVLCEGLPTTAVGCTMNDPGLEEMGGVAVPRKIRSSFQAALSDLRNASNPNTSFSPPLKLPSRSESPPREPVDEADRSLLRLVLLPNNPNPTLILPLRDLDDDVGFASI